MFITTKKIHPNGWIFFVYTILLYLKIKHIFEIIKASFAYPLELLCLFIIHSAIAFFFTIFDVQIGYFCQQNTQCSWSLVGVDTNFSKVNSAPSKSLSYVESRQSFSNSMIILFSSASCAPTCAEMRKHINYRAIIARFVVLALQCLRLLLPF